MKVKCMTYTKIGTKIRLNKEESKTIVIEDECFLQSFTLNL